VIKISVLSLSSLIRFITMAVKSGATEPDSGFGGGGVCVAIRVYAGVPSLYGSVRKCARDVGYGRDEAD
jgi:hypothetical protein